MRPVPRWWRRGNDRCRLWRTISGCYTTIRGGLRVLRRAGFEDHVALAQHHLAAKPVAFANVGDGAIVLSGNERALGIVQGPNVFVLRPEGLGHVPLAAAHSVLVV